MTGASGGFLDGDDLCAGCGACCHDVSALRVTEDELERLPLLRPFAAGEEAGFRLVDVRGPCPYLDQDRRCSVFDSRPFDCSLYPVNLTRVGTPAGRLAWVGDVGVRRSDGVIEARWHFGAADCPHRADLVVLARRESLAPVASWVATATRSSEVRMVAEPWTRVRAFAMSVLHRYGVWSPLRRLLGRPSPAVPSADRAGP